MTILTTWAAQWGIPAPALADLMTRVLRLDADVGPATGKSEAFAQSQVRLEASRIGARLWRNNVGAGYTEDGSFLRWGLANDSAQVNSVIKSGDLIGIRPVTIEQRHVGHTIGQFVSREIKAPGWTYRGTDREVAQMTWANLVNCMGGDACFATGPGSFDGRA